MKKTYKNGLCKAVTFSYDDGVMQDKRLVEIFNKYGIKCTFNLNYGLLDEETYWQTSGIKVQRIKKADVLSLYKGHEIANHGLYHPDISNLESIEKQHQIYYGKNKLDKLLNIDVKGMAYPFGTVDEEMISIMKECGIKYGRTVEISTSYTLPTNVYRWKPTAHHNDDNIFDIIEKFITTDFNRPSLLYIWGHSYEFDVDNNWEHIEKICKMISSKKDIWFCTNIDIINEME